MVLWDGGQLGQRAGPIRGLEDRRQRALPHRATEPGDDFVAPPLQKLVRIVVLLRALLSEQRPAVGPYNKRESEKCKGSEGGEIDCPPLP